MREGNCAERKPNTHLNGGATAASIVASTSSSLLLTLSGTVAGPSAAATCSAAVWHAGHSATRLLLHASHAAAAATATPSLEDDEEEAVEGVSGVGLAVGVVSDVDVAEELAIVGAEDGEEERLREE